MQARMTYNGTAVFGPVTVECVAAATVPSMTTVSITPSRLVAGDVTNIAVTPQVGSSACLLQGKPMGKDVLKLYRDESCTLNESLSSLEKVKQERCHKCWHALRSYEY